MRTNLLLSHSPPLLPLSLPGPFFRQSRREQIVAEPFNKPMFWKFNTAPFATPGVGPLYSATGQHFTYSPALLPPQQIAEPSRQLKLLVSHQRHLGVCYMKEQPGFGCSFKQHAERSKVISPVTILYLSLSSATQTHLSEPMSTADNV